MVQQVLDEVQISCPGCSVVAFADLSTNMVLLTNSDCDLARDELNALSVQARASLAAGTEAFLGTDDGFHLFLRAQSNDADALICVCDRGADIPVLMQTLRTALTEIEQTVT